MADKKISQLSSASTPLAGTEVLPIVQSSTTVKVASNDLTVRNVRANATTGILQVTGPAAASTRVMTVPDANFTAARTDAAQTFTGDQTFGTVLATTFDTNVAAAGVTLSGVTLSADGTDANININVTPKGSGEVTLPKVNIDGGAIDGTAIGANSASSGSFTTLNANNAVAFNGGSFTFNDNGANLDFRCEGDTDANLFFIDASADSIGVGTNVPSGKVDIRNAGGSTAYNVRTTASNIANPNSTGNELTCAQVTVGSNIIFSERQPDGAFADRCDLAVVTNTGFGLGLSEKVRLTSGGDVGVGVTAITAGAKVEIAGAVRTSAPAGGTAANWKLGTVHTVSPTSPNRTIEVDIGGTIYYLHAKTTNN